MRANLRVNPLFFSLNLLVKLLLPHPSLSRSDKRLPCLLKGLVKLWLRLSIPLVPATPPPLKTSSPIRRPARHLHKPRPPKLNRKLRMLRPKLLPTKSSVKRS